MSVRLCVNFRLGEEGFGLLLTQVKEILPVGDVTRVPLAPPSIRGITNVRGDVVTLIDVACLFDRELPPARVPEDRLALVFAPPHHHVGLYLHSPVEIGPADLDAVQGPAPTSGSRASDGATDPENREGPDTASGLVEIAGRIVLLLSASRLVRQCRMHVVDRYRKTV